MAPNNKTETLYLVDGTAQLYRAYFAIRGLTTAQGFPTNALFGFTSTLRKLITDESPTYIAVTFDLPGKVFRHDLFPEYKANRPPTPEDMKQQAPYARKICDALGVPVLEHQDYEADDLIATYTTRARELGWDVVIVSSDKDLLQLVDEHVTALNPSKNLRLDPAGVAESFGVPPGQVLDVLSLMGDSVDNIPGVPGVGGKTALQIVATYGSLEAVLERGHRFVELYAARDVALEAIEAKDDAALSEAVAPLVALIDPFVSAEQAEGWGEKLQPLQDALASDELAGNSKAVRTLKRELKAIDKGSQKKIWQAIEANNEQARLSRELATLHHEVPVDLAVDELKIGDVRRDEAVELFTFLEFTQHLNEIDAGGNPVATEQERTVDYSAVTDNASWERWVERCRQAGRFSIFPVTDPSEGLHPHLIGLALGCGEGAAVYVPLKHTYLGAPNLDEVDGLVELLGDGSVEKVAHGSKMVGHLLHRAGVQVEGWAFDPKLAGFVLNAGRGAHTLAALAQAIGRTPNERETLTGSGAKRRPIAEIEIESVVGYAAAEADAVFDVSSRLRRELDADQDLAKLYDTLEAPLLPVLTRMERLGIAVDVDCLATMSTKMAGQLEKLTEEIHELAGESFNVDSPKQLREILFDKMGLKAGKKTAKSKVASTDAQTLEALEHPIGVKLLEYRELAKLKGTYVDALPRLVDPETGRVHTTYDATGAATGRLSSSDPNLQNIPARTEAGRQIRAAFVPKDGCLFIASDYSQVELRVLAHLSGDTALNAAFQAGEDIHRYTAASVFGVMPELVTDEMRTRAKAVNFGILYGMSEFRLANEQGMSRAEAKQFIATYFERFASVQEYIETTRDAAIRDGAVRTLFGRVRWFPQLRGKVSHVAQEQALRAAVNTTIQGTAADLMKMAMLAVDEQLAQSGAEAQVLLQVHDELLLEVPEAELEATTELVRSAMEGVYPLSVPLAVDQKVGSSWFEVT